MFRIPVLNSEIRKRNGNPKINVFGWVRIDEHGRKKFHGGIDLVPKDKDPFNEPVYSTYEGKVIYARESSNAFGKFVIVKHDIDGKIYYSYYCHLNIIAVKKGDILKTTHYLGNIGYSGNASKGDEHLHFEIRDENWARLDPQKFITDEIT